MAIIDFTKDGQGFYDFDALLDLTSLDFVNEVKMGLDIKDELGHQYNIKIRVLDKIVFVYVFTHLFDGVVDIYRWTDGIISKSTVYAEEVKMFSEVFAHGS